MPPDPPTPVSPSSPAPDGSSAFGPFLLGVASWFGAWGIQMVAFQWLVVAVLEEPPARVGAAQMSMTLPSLLFLLMGGAAADRLDPRRMLMLVHTAAGLAVAALCGALVGGWLSYPLLLVYGFAFGTLQAFGLPARDTQLNDVAGGSMSRAVAGSLITQHGSQVLGAFAAGAAGWLGGAPILGLQALLMLLGVVPISRLPGRRPAPVARAPLTLREVGGGMLEVVRSPVLRPVLFLAVATGLFFVGPFLVVLPLMVRDVYGGGAGEMGVLSAMFPLGAVSGGLLVYWAGGIRRNGPALILGQCAASASIGVIAVGIPFAGAVAAVYAWGLAGAFFINAGRTIFQTHASEAHRARVLSVYMLGVMGGGPIGSLLSGLLAEPLGLHTTLALDAGLALAIALAVATFTRLPRIH
ncbi:MAG: MFS transporter [Myxococcota bacterium]